MRQIIRYIGFIVCMILSLPLAIGGVEKITFGTDNYWKTLDFEDSGWTSVNYDDSWWEDADIINYAVVDFNANYIWYPGSDETVKRTVYFRKSINIDGNKIINGLIHTEAGSNNEINLYVNEVFVGRWVDSYYVTIDITKYLKPGNNAIAVSKKDTNVIAPAFILDGVIRYGT